MARDVLTGLPRAPHHLGLPAHSSQFAGGSATKSLALALGAGGEGGYTAPGFYAWQIKAGTAIAFKLWGSGGAAGQYRTETTSRGGHGGYGGFCSGVFTAPADGLLVLELGAAVDQRGAGSFSNPASPAPWLLGAYGGPLVFPGGIGGGRTALWFNGTLIAVAGGGGGGGGVPETQYNAYGGDGGQGGGDTAGAGGVGWGNTAGGSGGQSATPRRPLGGYDITTYGTTYYGNFKGGGGGGGAGYGGGAAGVPGYGNDYGGGGGGGGSGYLSPSVVSGQNLASRNTGDADYAGNAGMRGESTTSGTSAPVMGRAVLRW